MTYSTRMITRFSSVDTSMPPATEVPTECRAARPAPVSDAPETLLGGALEGLAVRRVGDADQRPRALEQPLAEVIVRVPFQDQNSYLALLLSTAKKTYAIKNSYIRRRAWFHNFLYPMTFMYLRSAMLEYQNRAQELESSL